MIEQKLFDKDKETNCDIMFLVRRGKQTRLMSFKSNPWLDFDEFVDEDGDKDIVKASIYLFSGNLLNMPTEDNDGNSIPVNNQTLKQYSRRFNNDKVQCAQLITKQLGSY